MIMTKLFKRLAFMAGLLLMVTSAAHAQKVTPPAGLKWEPMKEVVFNSNVFSSTGDESDRKMAQAIWAKEIAVDVKGDNRGPNPGFTLIGTAAVGVDQWFFTMYSSASRTISGACEPAPNGRDQTQIYSNCPMRVIKIAADGPPKLQEFQSYCMMRGDSRDNPRAKNHNEFAIDSNRGLVFFRTIQYGHVVPECDRMIRIGG